MKFKIIGTADPKIRNALRNLVKAFDKSNDIDDKDFTHTVYISTVLHDKEIKVIIKYENDIIESKILIFNDDDIKYLILTSFYQLLVKLTHKTLNYGVLTGIRPTKLVHHYKQQYSDDEIRQLLHQKYLISFEKIDLLLTIVNHQLKLFKDFETLRDEVSIYINIPYCLSRCSYCSFTSYPNNYAPVSHRDYLTALITEIKEMGLYLKNNKIKITTIYIGGGTPTALNDEELSILLENVENYLLFNQVLEYTVECGRPDSLTISKLNIIKKFQVSRISINPQTFNEETLKMINRYHTTEDILHAYELAKKCGLNNINMDLIIGLPNETIKDFEVSINKTLSLLPPSITIHYLAQKRGAQLFNENFDNKVNDYMEAFDYAYKNLLDKGYFPYYLYRQKNIRGNLENVGYSQPGYESLYNILMIEEQQNIIGLGCHASSKFLNYEMILNPKDLITYVKSYQDYLQKKICLLDKVLLKRGKKIERFI